MATTQDYLQISQAVYNETITQVAEYSTMNFDSESDAIYNKDAIKAKFDELIASEMDPTKIAEYQRLKSKVDNIDEYGHYHNAISGFDGAIYYKGSGTNFSDVVFACRGTDGSDLGAFPMDVIGDDMALYRDKTPSQYQDALDFYSIIKTYNSAITNSKFDTTDISFTGHSLGGAIAQLMGATTFLQTVTFNGPGIQNCVPADFYIQLMNKFGNQSFNNITDYSIANDFIGNLGIDLGKSYLLPPMAFDTTSGEWAAHNGFNNLSENIDKAVQKPSSWGFENSVALYYYDANNTNNIVRSMLAGTLALDSRYRNLSKELLDETVNMLINNFPTPTKTLHYTTGEGDFIIGDATGILPSGSNYADKIWGNEGSDNINGGLGNDTLDGGFGNDKYVFTTGDGQDVINDVAEATISSKGISFMNKNGSVVVDGLTLNGGKWDEETQSYTSLDTGVDYNWNGVNGSNLIINYGAGDSVTVESFSNGDLGIQFDRSIEKDPEKIADQLKKDKQNYADKVVSGEIVANADYKKLAKCA